MGMTDNEKIMRELKRIRHLLALLLQMEGIQMKEIDDLQAATEEETTVNQSAITLLTNLAALIEANKADPAKLTALATQIRQNSADLAASVSTNTPADTGGTGATGPTP